MLIYWGIIALLALTAFQPSDALKCYRCNSHHDTDCMALDAAKSQTIICPENMTSCKVITQEAPFKTDSKSSTQAPGTRIFRGCSKVSIQDFGSACIDRVGTDKVKIRYCLCDADGCNEAPSTLRLTSWTLVSFLTCLVWFTNSRLI